MAPIRPYRDFMTPALHRRFASASLYSMFFCYVIAVLMGNWEHVFWSIFPLGSVGIRTILLFIPTMIVYILRVAQMHIGQRSTASPFDTFRKYAIRIDTLRTIMAYGLSSWVFCEVYIWTRHTAARLDYTDPGKLHERVRLNERPIFLRSLFIFLAVAQAINHLWHDYDRIPIPGPTLKSSKENSKSTTRKPLYSHLMDKIPSILDKSVKIVAVAGVAGTLLYYLGFRHLIWNWHYAFARHLVNVPKSFKPPGIYGLLELIAKFAVEGMYLILLWEISNTLFDVLMAEEPLKKGKPITNDSKDPNGSLLNGLKAKREVPKNIAFWELALITDRFDDRRVTIYDDVDRKNGLTGSQIVQICLAEVRAICSRIDALNPATAQGKAKVEISSEKKTFPQVPKIASPLKKENITGPGVAPGTRLQKLEAFTSDVAKVHSSPENAANSKAKKMIESGSKSIQQGVQQSKGFVEQNTEKYLGSWFGFIFKQPIRRTANLVINGAPYSRASLIGNALQALTKLSVRSLKEDKLGQFNKDVPEIVRVLTTTLKKVQDYVGSLAIEQTAEALEKEVPEVVAVKACLRDSLEQILTAFAEYLPHMGISRADLQEAKKLVEAEKSPKR